MLFREILISFSPLLEGTWGDMMASILDGGADLKRRIWIDIFASRQWPSRFPDLEFHSLIEHAKAFHVINSSLKEIEHLDLNSYVFYQSERKKEVKFFRSNDIEVILGDPPVSSPRKTSSRVSLSPPSKPY